MIAIQTNKIDVDITEAQSAVTVLMEWSGKPDEAQIRDMLSDAYTDMGPKKFVYSLRTASTPASGIGTFEMKYLEFTDAMAISLGRTHWVVLMQQARMYFNTEALETLAIRTLPDESSSFDITPITVEEYPNYTTTDPRGPMRGAKHGETQQSN